MASNSRCKAAVLGRTDEAIELYKLAVALDPLRANFQLALGYELFNQGRCHARSSSPKLSGGS
jgi:hypothetical protein